MKPEEAFAKFVRGALAPAKAERYLALHGSKKGKAKILADLYHGFEDAIRPEVVRAGETQGTDACFVFAETQGFGVEYSHVGEALDALALDDGWLIVTQDGTMGVYRPESRWDDQKLMKIEQKAGAYR